MPKRVDTAGKKRPSRSRLIVIVTVLCAVSTVLAILAFDRLPSIIGDNAEFAILGKAVAAGKGVRYINHPDMRPATKYPPGFPVMLAAWMTIFGESMTVMKALVVACFVGTVAATFVLARLFLDEIMSVLAALMVASSFTVVTYSHQVLSDLPYAFFSLLALVFLLGGRHERRNLIIAICLSIWAYLLRTVAVSLIFAACVLLFRKARRREALVLICVLVVVSVLWTVRNYSLTGEGSRYTRVLLQANPYDPDLGPVTFGGLLSRAVVNLGSYVGGLLPVTLFPTLLTAAGGGLRALPLRAVISGLILIGVGVGGYSVRGRGRTLVVYLAAYLAVYLAWPEVWRSERFMVPVAPVAAVLFLAGMVEILKYFEVKKLVMVAVCIVLVASNIPTLAGYIKRPRGYTPGWHNYMQTATWVADNTPQDAVVLCRKPFLFHIFSKRMTVGYPYTQDAEAIRAYLLEALPDYAVLEDFGMGVSATTFYILPALDGMPGSYRRVFSTDEPVNTVIELALTHAEGSR